MGAKKERRPILLISLDAVSDSNVDYLLSLPNFRKLASLGTLHRDVSSLFVSNTYPIHTSISTGLLPCEHGIFDNTIQDPKTGKEIWRDHKKYIHATTLPERAASKGLTTCAMMYPITSGEKIRYHFPEIPGRVSAKKKAMKLLRYGNRRFMAHYYAKYSRDLRTHNHSGMDDFITHTATDLLKKNKADLYMLHLLDVDSTKHRYGATSDEAFAALARIDHRLGEFLEVFESIGFSKLRILIFSDHSCMDVKHTIRPNDMLSEHGISFDTAYFHSTHGCCFLHIADNITSSERETLDSFLEIFSHTKGVARALTEEELRTSGAINEGFSKGYTAKKDYVFGRKYKGQHGYALDNEDYKTFYLEIVPGKPKETVTGGSIIEVGKEVISLVESY